MLATEFLFSGTFSLRTPDKHIKSQQESTLAKYEKNVSFFASVILPFRRHVFMQINLITDKFYNKISF